MKTKLGQKIFYEDPSERIKEGTVIGWRGDKVFVHTDDCRFDAKPDDCFETYDEALANQWLRRQREVDAELGKIADASALLKYVLSEIEGYVPKKVLVLKAKELLGIDLEGRKDAKLAVGDKVFYPNNYDDVVLGEVIDTDGIESTGRVTVNADGFRFDVAASECFKSYEDALEHMKEG